MKIQVNKIVRDTNISTFRTKLQIKMPYKTKK